MWIYTLLPKILNMSLTASIVIVFVLLARVLLKKAPKIFSYALWAVVLFRLVCPVSFSAEFSLLGIFNAPSATNGTVAYIPADVVHREYPQVNLPFPAVSEAINNTLPQGEEQLVADPLEGLVSMATLLWLFGIAAMLIYSMVSLLRLRRKLIGAVCLRDNIYLADHIATPFVIGVFRPKIYLPSTLAEQEQSYIILHEQTHIRRLDHIIKMVAFLALAVHWFNPLVWAAFVCAVKDMEMSCDEHILEQMGFAIKGAYSTSLLSFAAGWRLISGSPLAFGEGNIKGRIKNVMNFKKPAVWVTVVSVLLVAALSIGFAVNQADGKILTAQAALEAFSAENKDGQVIFVIPKGYDRPQNWNISVAGRAEYEDGFSQSIHLLEDINEAKAWEAGKEYTIEINDSFTELHITVSLPDENGKMLVRHFDFDFTPDVSDTWIPQPEIENQDDYFAALNAARESVKAEEIAVDDLGSNEKIARAWMEAWFAMFAALPEDNMARITAGAIDSLQITKVSKPELPKAFVFSVTCSVRPTYPIANNAFWMAGNTGNSPGRDETWGQLSREVALHIGDDGRYHFLEMGTGGVGRSEEFELLALQQAAEKWMLIAEADVTGDGINERFYLDKSQMDITAFDVTLHVLDNTGNEIWNESGNSSHVGWKSLFLCQMNGKEYLLRYTPYMGQGYCTYTYTLFALENGKEKVYKTNTLEFDINGIEKLNTPKMIAYADEVNDLLGKSVLLMSTEGGIYSFGPASAESFFERYSWLDNSPALFNPADSLATKLEKYSNWAVKNRRLSDL